MLIDVEPYKRRGAHNRVLEIWIKLWAELIPNRAIDDVVTAMVSFNWVNVSLSILIQDPKIIKLTNNLPRRRVVNFGSRDLGNYNIAHPDHRVLRKKSPGSLRQL